MKRPIARLLFTALFLTVPLRVDSDTPAVIIDPGVRFDQVAAAKADPLFDYATFKKLMSFTVNVNWNSVDIQAALDQLSDKSKKADPAKIGIKFSLQVPTDSDGKTYHREVSMTLTYVPIFDVVEYVSGQTKLIPLIHKNKVIMMPGIETRLKPSPVEKNWER